MGKKLRGFIFWQTPFDGLDNSDNWNGPCFYLESRDILSVANNVERWWRCCWWKRSPADYEAWESSGVSQNFGKPPQETLGAQIRMGQVSFAGRFIELIKETVQSHYLQFRLFSFNKTLRILYQDDDWQQQDANLSSTVDPWQLFLCEPKSRL